MLRGGKENAKEESPAIIKGKVRDWNKSVAFKSYTRRWNCKVSGNQKQWNPVIYLCQDLSEEEKKSFQFSDMGDWTDGNAMCSETGEKNRYF